jgi:hypothetical protein
MAWGWGWGWGRPGLFRCHISRALVTADIVPSVRARFAGFVDDMRAVFSAFAKSVTMQAILATCAALYGVRAVLAGMASRNPIRAVQNALAVIDVAPSFAGPRRRWRFVEDNSEA